MNNKNELTEIRTYELPVKNVIYRWTGWPGIKQKNLEWHKFTYLDTHSRKPFVDIQDDLREKWLSRVGWVKKNKLPYYLCSINKLEIIKNYFFAKHFEPVKKYHF